ncbi:MAG: sensor histidine kinase [Hyphomicrobiaceae bacterium]
MQRELNKQTDDRAVEPVAASQPASVGKALRSIWRWDELRLPAKLLLLTTMFVMLAEVLIFVPSVANHRVQWLQDRVVAGKLAGLAAIAVPGGAVPDNLRNELLETAQVKSVAWRRDGRRRLVLPADGPLVVSQMFDMRPIVMDGNVFGSVATRIGLIRDAMAAIIETSDRTVRVVAPLESNNEVDFIEIVVSEKPLTAELRAYGLNILFLSIVISLFTAALVYYALSRLLVRPMMRITENMLQFSEKPEDASRIIIPSSRSDEIGVAERELAGMQGQLSQLLLQKNRLAQLGLAVSKISHDLRNMLANAQLISDRLSGLDDPTVQRFAPKLIASLDRAINFCNDSLRFGKAEEAAPRRDIFSLSDIVDEVGSGLGLPKPGDIDWIVDVDSNTQIDADRDHLFRILTNICRNSVQVLESRDEHGEIRIKGWRDGRRTLVEIHDNGPGVPPRAREHLFEAFQGSVRQGGTGLGLVIAHELLQAHGGSVELLDTDKGATFLIAIPDRSAA